MSGDEVVVHCPWCGAAVHVDVRVSQVGMIRGPFNPAGPALGVVFAQQEIDHVCR